MHLPVCTAKGGLASVEEHFIADVLRVGELYSIFKLSLSPGN